MLHLCTYQSPSEIQTESTGAVFISSLDPPASIAPVSKASSAAGPQRDGLPSLSLWVIPSRLFSPENFWQRPELLAGRGRESNGALPSQKKMLLSEAKLPLPLIPSTSLAPSHMVLYSLLESHTCHPQWQFGAPLRLAYLSPFQR